MAAAIISAAIGVWLLVGVLVLGLCRDAKEGDRALDLAVRQSRLDGAEWASLEAAAIRPSTATTSVTRPVVTIS